MANEDMNVSLIVRLVDQFTQPATKVRASIRGFFSGLRDGFSEAITTGFTASRLDKAIDDAETKLNNARGRLLGAFGQAVSLAAPVLALGNFESQLVNFGNTAQIYGDDLTEVGARLRALGPVVNKSASELLVALEYLVGKGLSPDEGMKALEAVGMTATATSSEIEDMAASGFAVLDNLKVPAEELQRAFDAMNQAGKSGGFELKGMAQYFPQLTASARALGMEGVPAVAELGAALQIAMKGAGSESEAANNMQNFLSKLSSPETVKRFKDMGINVQAEFQKAADGNVSVFEHMLGVINDATEGDQFKMGELFGDQQVLNFLRPMMANLDEFRIIRDAAMTADGINADDFGRVMETWEQKAKSATIALDNLLSNSSVLLEIAKDLAGTIRDVVTALNDFATTNPEVARGVVMAIAGLMTLSIAARLVTFAFAGLRLSSLGVINAFLRFDEAGKNIALGWRLIAGLGSLLAGAFGLVKAAAIAVGGALAGISAPVWGVIAVLAAAAFTIWKFWDRISSFVSGMASGLGEVLGPAVSAIGDAISGLVTKLGELFGLDAEQMEGFKASISGAFEGAFAGIGSMVDGAKELLGGFWDWLGSFFQQETLSDEQKGQMHEAGRKLVTDMLEGIKSAAVGMFEWFANLPAEIAKHIGSIDLGALIQWPEPPDWLAWMFGGDAPPPSAPGGGGNDIPPAGGGGGGDWWNPWSWSQQPEVQATIAAEVVDNRPPQVSVTVNQTITGVADPKQAGTIAAGQIAGAVNQARNGALHDGME